MEVSTFWDWLGDSWMVVAFIAGALILFGRAYTPLAKIFKPWTSQLQEHLDHRIDELNARLDHHELQCKYEREHVHELLESIVKKLEKREEQHTELLERVARIEERVRK